MLETPIFVEVFPQVLSFLPAAPLLSAYSFSFIRLNHEINIRTYRSLLSNYILGIIVSIRLADSLSQYTVIAFSMLNMRQPTCCNNEPQ